MQIEYSYSSPIYDEDTCISCTKHSKGKTLFPPLTTQLGTCKLFLSAPQKAANPDILTKHKDNSWVVQG